MKEGRTYCTTTFQRKFIFKIYVFRKNNKILKYLNYLIILLQCNTKEWKNIFHFEIVSELRAIFKKNL